MKDRVLVGSCVRSGRALHVPLTRHTSETNVFVSSEKKNRMVEWTWMETALQNRSDNKFRPTF